MYSDYHMHSVFSPDSTESPEKIIEKCISLNMEECCFTDHNDFVWPNKNENFDLDVKSYFEQLTILSEKYKNKINVNIGVECGMTPDNITLNRDFIKNNHFDFVIASCHIVDNMDPYYPEFFENISDRTAFEKYFNALKIGIDGFSDFDILGHIDYIVRYCPNKHSNYSAFDYMDIIDYILKKIIYSGKGIEINTSGLKSGLPFANPCPDILKRYKELGGEIITLGSDAHSTEFVGYKFSQAVDFLKSTGFERYCIFINRKALFKKL